MPPRGRDGLVEQEARPGVRAPLDDEQRRTRRQSFDAGHRAFRTWLGGRVQFVEEVGAEDGRRLHRDLIRSLVVVHVRHPLLLTDHRGVACPGQLARFPLGTHWVTHSVTRSVFKPHTAGYRPLVQMC